MVGCGLTRNLMFYESLWLEEGEVASRNEILKQTKKFCDKGLLTICVQTMQYNSIFFYSL
jgi:hypothetical protein